MQAAKNTNTRKQVNTFIDFKQPSFEQVLLICDVLPLVVTRGLACRMRIYIREGARGL